MAAGAGALIAAAVNERVVMEILGQSTLVMAQGYSHVLGPMITNAADRLEALWARNQACFGLSLGR